MVFILGFDEVALCWGVSLDTATRIIERDLPIVPLQGRGDGVRQNRGVELEALEIYAQKVSVYNSPLAEEIQRELVQRRAERHAAYEKRIAERGAQKSADNQIPELVRARRAQRGSKRGRRGSPDSDDTGGSGSATST